MTEFPHGHGDVLSSSGAGAVAATGQSSAPFLRMPIELREMIYCHIFISSPNWIRLDTAGPLDAPLFGDCCSPLDDSHAMDVYGLILSCRQLYAETIDMYYTNTTFYMYNFNAGLRRIARMPEKHRNAMTDIRLCCSPRIPLETEVGGTMTDQQRNRACEAWKNNSLFQLRKGLEQAGIKLREGVLRTDDAPEGLDSRDGEYSELTEMFGRGPGPNRWRGKTGRDGLGKAWSKRTGKRTQDLTRYESIIQHSMGMGERAEKMSCWIEGGLNM